MLATFPNGCVLDHTSGAAPPGLRLCPHAVPAAEHHVPPPHARKRRKKDAEAMDDFPEHVRIRPVVMAALAALASSGYTFPALGEAACSRVHDTPTFYAEECSRLAGEGTGVRDTVCVGQCAADGDFFHRVVLCSAPCGVRIRGAVHVLPGDCAVCMSDVSVLPQLVPRLVAARGPFDLVVLDPPWPNRSAQRTGAYATLAPEHILHMPVEALCAPGALVAVWVTNRQAHVDYVRDVLFRCWGVALLATW